MSYLENTDQRANIINNLRNNGRLDGVLYDSVMLVNPVMQLEEVDLGRAHSPTDAVFYWPGGSPDGNEAFSTLHTVGQSDESIRHAYATLRFMSIGQSALTRLPSTQNASKSPVPILHDLLACDQQKVPYGICQISQGRPGSGLEGTRIATLWYPDFSLSHRVLRHMKREARKHLPDTSSASTSSSA